MIVAIALMENLGKYRYCRCRLSQHGPVAEALRKLENYLNTTMFIREYISYAFDKCRRPYSTGMPIFVLTGLRGLSWTKGSIVGHRTVSILELSDIQGEILWNFQPIPF
jgi:hypothetical protein